MKYIVLRTTNGDIVRDIPFIFPNHLVHADVAEALADMLIRKYASGSPATVQAISAGEISSLEIAGDTHSCDGESTTLHLKSRGEEDSRMINTYDYYHGIV